MRKERGKEASLSVENRENCERDRKKEGRIHSSIYSTFYTVHALSYSSYSLHRPSTRVSPSLPPLSSFPQGLTHFNTTIIQSLTRCFYIRMWTSKKRDSPSYLYSLFHLLSFIILLSFLTSLSLLIRDVDCLGFESPWTTRPSTEWSIDRDYLDSFKDEFTRFYTRYSDTLARRRLQWQMNYPRERGTLSE